MKHRWKTLLQYGAAAVCVALVVRLLAANREGLSLVGNLTPWKVATLAALYLSFLLVYSFQFYLVLKKSGDAAVPFFVWFKTFVLASFLNTLVPQAGNLYRAVWLKSRYALSYTRYVAVYFSFAWLDTCLGLLLSTVVIVVAGRKLAIGGIRVYCLAAACFVACALLPPLVELAWRWAPVRARYLAWVHGRIADMLRVSVSSAGDPFYLLRFSLAATASFANMLAMFFAAFWCLGVPIDVPTVTLYYVVLQFGSRIIITPGNLGVQELAYGLISSSLGGSMAEGILASVVIRVVTTTSLIAIGVAFGGCDVLRHRPAQETDEAAVPLSG